MKTPALTTQDESTVNSDSVRQLVLAQDEQVAELEASQTQNDNAATPSDHQPDLRDTTTSKEDSSAFQKVSESTTDMGDGQNTVLAESTVDNDGEGSQKEAQTVSAGHDDSEDDQTRLETAPDFDKNLAHGQNEVFTESIRDDSVENDRIEAPTADHVDDTLTTGPDGVRETAADTGELEVDDSGGDEMSEDQFLSPAASDPDSERSSPTKEQAAAVPDDVEDRAGSSAEWTSKVPLLETEPPAMDSDYEEAPLCEVEKESETVRQNSGEFEEEHSRLDGDGNTSDQATPVATTAVKPKPM